MESGMSKTADKKRRKYIRKQYLDLAKLHRQVSENHRIMAALYEVLAEQEWPKATVKK